MNFLAPLFLAGAAAVALPFLFHLIRRSSREKIVFSSLMFLEPSPPRITKRSRLEHILLLLLRCAVICLLAFAFARPFLQKPLTGERGGAKNARVAVLVDASASMRREDLWTQARTRAIEAIRQLKPSDTVALYTFDQQLNTVLNFADADRLSPSERTAAAETRLAALQPSWAGTHLGHALINATEHLLEQSNRDSKEQGNSALRLVVISDLQSGARLDGLQGFEWPKNLEVQVDGVSGKELSNASLQVLEENQKLFAADTNAPVRLRVSNGNRSSVEQFTLQWRNPAGQTGEAAKTYVPPGQNRTLTLTGIPRDAQSVTLGGDRVDFDNTVYLARAKADPVTVSYFGTARADDPAEMRYYLHRAFEQTNLSTRVLAFSNSIPAAAAESGLLILGATPSEEALTLARTLLRRGRTVLLPLRDSAEANAISTLAGGFLAAAAEAQVANYALFGQISFQNPLFAPFADSRFSDFTKIHFWKYRALKLASITNSVTIASFDSGSPLLAEVPVEKGRLLLLATTWMPSDSQLALSSKFVPLLFGILEQSAGLRVTAHQFLVGERVPLPGSTTEVRLPTGTTKVAHENFSEAFEPGVYSAGDYQFAVNLAPSESTITPLTPEELNSLGVPLRARTDTAEEARAEQRQRHLLATETEARQKLWRNFILAAVALILLETWLSGRISRTVAPA